MSEAKALSGGNMSWYKAEDFLPEKSGEYIVAFRADTVLGTVVSYQIVPYSAKYKKWNHYDGLGSDFDHSFDDVYAWAEIPECKLE